MRAAAILLAGAATLAGLGGCASEWAGVPPVAKRSVVSFTVPATACTFALEGIEDRREYPDLWRAETGSLFSGRVQAAVIRSDGLLEWLGSGVKAIPGYAPEDAGTSIRIAFLKAYVDAVGPVLRTDLVVRVHAGEAERLYRGSDLASPWTGIGEGDVQAALDRAMGSLLRKMADDVGSWCSSSPVGVTQD